MFWSVAECSGVFLRAHGFFLLRECQINVLFLSDIPGKSDGERQSCLIENNNNSFTNHNHTVRLGARQRYPTTTWYLKR